MQNEMDLRTWVEQRGGISRLSYLDRLGLLIKLAVALEALHLEGRNCDLLSPGRIFLKPDKTPDDPLGMTVALNRSDQPPSDSGETSPLTGATRLFEDELEYRAPEAGEFQHSRTGADLYALGIVGQHLFSGGFAEPMPADWDRGVPDARLQRLLRRCASHDPTLRPRNATEIVEELRGIHRSPRNTRDEGCWSPDASHQDHRSWRRGLQCSAVAALVSCVLLVTPFGEGLVYSSYSLGFAFQRNAGPFEATILYMDEYSHRTLGQPKEGKWDRRVHARLIRELARRGAKAVVFDVLFDEPAAAEEEDHEFIAAARAYGKVVVGAKLESETINGENVASKIVAPIEAIRKVVSWGLVERADVGSRVWRHFPGALGKLSLAQEVARRNPPAVPLDPQADRWINFYGPPGTIPHQSFADVLQPRAIPDTAISNKFIFVGAGVETGFSGGRVADEYITPFTRQAQQKSPGVEINATVFLNLLRGDGLRRLSVAEELGLLALTALAFGVCSIAPRRALAVEGCLGLAGLVTILSIGSAIWQFVWFPWLIVVVGQMPAALVCSLLAPWRARIKISDLDLLKVIGSGASGEVWLARDAANEFKAVKVIRRGRFRGARGYFQELTALERVAALSRQCPHLISVLHLGDYGTREGYYYVMDLADDLTRGRNISPERYERKTLETLLALVAASKPAPGGATFGPAEWRRVGLAVAEAMDFLHTRGVVHRDIKPANILYLYDQPCLADVGSATVIADARRAPSHGTPGYIAPEGSGTPVADIYSFGITMSQCLKAADFSNASADVVQSAAAIVERAIRREPSLRYQSAKAVKADLLKLEQAA